MTNAAPSRIYFRPTECPALFVISVATLYRWAAAKCITIHKEGAISFVKVADMDAAIERRGEINWVKTPRESFCSTALVVSGRRNAT